MKIAYLLAAIPALSAPVFAQVTNLEAEGNLAATRNPGCIAPINAGNDLSPADLALGVVTCADEDRYDQAIDMFVLMQLRAVFDSRRVADKTAHQAGQVLALNIQNALQGPRLTKLQNAFTAFGESGSLRHKVICDVAVASGPPDYFPSYMIQHGMAAFTGIEGDGLVKDFDAKQVWQDLLSSYLKC